MDYCRLPPPRLANYLIDPSSIWHRAIGSVLDHEDAEQTRDVFTFLKSQIPSTGVNDLKDAQDEEIEDYWSKIYLLGDAYVMINQKRIFEERAYGEATITAEMGEFIDSYTDAVQKIGKSIEELDDFDLLWFLAF